MKSSPDVDEDTGGDRDDPTFRRTALHLVGNDGSPVEMDQQAHVCIMEGIIVQIPPSRKRSECSDQVVPRRLVAFKEFVDPLLPSPLLCHSPSLPHGTGFVRSKRFTCGPGRICKKNLLRSLSNVRRAAAELGQPCRRKGLWRG